MEPTTSEQAKMVLSLVYAGMSVLNARILSLLAMMMMFSLACWTMWDATVHRIITLSIFGVLVFIPVLMMDRRTAQQRNAIGADA